jgi:glycogen synthase
VEVHRVRHGPDWSRIRGLWRLNRVWPGFAWAASRRLRRIHKSSPVQVVEAAEVRADSLFVPLLRDRPRLIVRLHTARIFIDRMNRVAADRKQRLLYFQEACAIRSADFVTAPSRAVIDLTRTWVRLGKRKVRMVPNPVNTSAYTPAPAKRSGEILIVGRLEVNKGVLVMEAALPVILRRRPRVVVRFAGADGVDASGRSWRARLTESLAPGDRERVLFEQLTREQLVMRYRQADLCVLPSLWENFPYALLEALSCGVPVVGTRAGGVPELVDDGVTGRIVPAGDSVALADAVCGLMDDEALRVRMSQAARQRSERQYSLEKVVPEMLNLYRAVYAGGPS